MVISNDITFSDYSLLNTWWDECENLGFVENNKVILDKDFLVEKRVDNFIIISGGYPLFEYNSMRTDGRIWIDLQPVADFTVTQFEVIHHAFICHLDKSYDNLREEVRIKEMIDAPNSKAAIELLVNKYYGDSQ